MIALTLENGQLLKLISDEGGRFGFHKFFGLISQGLASERSLMRKRAGLKTPNAWEALFDIQSNNGELLVAAGNGCTAKQDAKGAWVVQTPRGALLVAHEATTVPTSYYPTTDSSNRKAIVAALLIALLLISGVFFIRPAALEMEEPPIPVTMILPETKSVPVPAPQSMERMQIASTVENKLKPGGASVDQNLGFLRVLGKKDLKKIIGGTPLEVKDVSPGAGPGGKEGSGGELLVGLGKGVKQTTVGNTGTVGLGGIGHKGAGGGEGGYGTSWIGSGGRGNTLDGIGNGRRLASAVTLSQDMVLEGGLDPEVIRATIAKYLSEVRACYETGLRTNPGLAGRVTTAFVINGKGKIDTVNVVKSSLGHSGVEGCISQAMRGWVFPEPRGGVNVKVSSYPFELSPIKS